ncbi:MAG TPA: DUF971 domain-containing protein [Terriglobales bacterium]|nr:DUF971 domain-containing protein [Terriglobales bacterium]
MPALIQPKKVQVNLTAGTGMEIEWQDGHRSSYTFPYLRDACPCATCDDERSRDGREPGEAPKPAPGSLPMFREAPRATHAEAVGKYAIRFTFHDGHQHGIYSWEYLRDVCPCAECKARQKGAGSETGPMISTRRAGGTQ